jgi:hypothetical protein
MRRRRGALRTTHFFFPAVDARRFRVVCDEFRPDSAGAVNAELA